MEKNTTLIISGLPFRNDTNLGKTLSTMFSGFNSDNLIQLYFSPQTPNVKCCSSYFQVNEKQLIQSFFGLVRRKCGRVIESSDITNHYSVAETNPSSILALKKHEFIPIMRDVLWMVSKWKSPKMDKWIYDNHISVIFALLPGSVKSCKIIEYIAKRTGCPVILFVTDDYYNDFELHPGLWRRLYFRWLQKSVDKVAKYAKYVVGSSLLAAEEFGKKYDVPYDPIYAPSGEAYLKLPIHSTTSFPIIFRYFGNLGIERWKPLRELGMAISKYNSGEKKAILEVYSNLTYPDAIAKLDIPNGCVFKGWTQGEEYMRLLQEADVAVHVESFSEEMCRRTRLSISTKIADYLGAGKCILAIGKSDLASIKHIIPVACVVNDFDSLKEAIERLVENQEYRECLSYKARCLAKEQHSIIKIPKKLGQIIYSVQKN